MRNLFADSPVRYAKYPSCFPLEVKVFFTRPQKEIVRLSLQVCFFFLFVFFVFLFSLFFFIFFLFVFSFCVCFPLSTERIVDYVTPASLSHSIVRLPL